MNHAERTRPRAPGQWALAAFLVLPLWTSVTRAQAPAPPPETIPFPLDQVRPGLKGVAYTVFQGVRPEPMEVEILGRLRNALGPGRDMILARLHGPKPEYTGVVAGMSGSPVYIDGKLLGALSYRIGQFSKEPIAGITPIAQMLEVRDLPPNLGSATPADPPGNFPELRPIESPLVFGGFSQEALDRFAAPFRSMGLIPVSGIGGMDTSHADPAPLQPGSAVSAVLVDGDLSVTGTCTVSYLQANRLLACGHPITQSGAIDLPMAKAEVLATLPSPLNSFKIVNATEIVGAFTEDRASAIYGLVGARAHMIPVSVDLDGPGMSQKTFHVQIANHRELTPQLMIISVFQMMQQTLTGSSDASYKLTGELTLARNDGRGPALPPVRFTDWMAPGDFNSGAVNAAIAVGLKFQALFSNVEEQPLMTGVSLHLQVSPRRRSATLESARLLTPEARAGEPVQVEAMLQPYQQPAQLLHIQITLPRSVEPGTLRLLVSDGATVDRLLAPVTAHDTGLADTVARLNAEHGNDHLYVTLLDRNAQAVLDAAALSDVPLSMANVLDPLKAAQRLRLTGESVVELGSMAAEDAVSGSQVLSLTVR